MTTNNEILPGQYYESLYIDGALADTFYVKKISENTAFLTSLSTTKPVRIDIAKMHTDIQHGRLRQKN